MSKRWSIKVEHIHHLYETYQQLHYNEQSSVSDLISHKYHANTSISTIRCFWQHLVSSTVGADLATIKVMYQGRDRRVQRKGVVPDRHRNGNLLTIGDLSTIANWNNDPDFELWLTFDYVKDSSEVLPDCICNF